MKFDSVEHVTADTALVNGACRPPNSTVTSIAARRPKRELVVADWETMFEAVTMTLRRSVGSRLLSNGPLQHASLGTRGQVLQCVDALDQLRTSMLEHLARTCEHEAELRAALALATAELADAHANAETARYEAATETGLAGAGVTSSPACSGTRRPGARP